MYHCSILKIFHESDFVPNLGFISLSDSYKRCSLEECDLIIYHELLQAQKDPEAALKKISETYKGLPKKVLVFVLNDFEKRYRYFPNLIIARTSARASRLRKNEIILPYIWECHDNAFEPKVHSGKPLVGFCGLATKYRKKIIRTFQKSNEVTDDFIIRDKFWGGNPHDSTLINEYYDNIRRNQFILCNRGAGNFSMRFYQTLSCGRIPVLVNTNMQLPFADRIGWSSHIIFEKNETACLKKTLEIHRSGNHMEMQKKNRKLFDEYFIFRNYFDRLAEDLKKFL